MQSVEQLLWSLTEFRDLYFKSCPLYGVTQSFEVDPALVGHWVEYIVILNRTLLRAKDQINPQVDVLRHIV